jgi:hypothetical protein
MAREQYQILRSVSDVHVFVVCLDGSFYERVPADVRRLGLHQDIYGPATWHLAAFPPAEDAALGAKLKASIRCDVRKGSLRRCDVPLNAGRPDNAHFIDAGTVERGLPHPGTIGPDVET